LESAVLRYRAPLCAFVVASFASLAVAEDWPQWRGPHGDGHSDQKGVPVHWDAKSIVWKTPLPGDGQSSPVIWGERIFLTSAFGKGNKRVVLGLDRRKGNILWQREAWEGSPEKSHAMNGWATATCATDGERVVAFFGKGGLHCYDNDGKPLWSRDLGPFEGPWGTAACPIIVGDLVIQNCDALEKASLRAFDKRTGKDAWTTPRSVPERGGWSTPVLVDAKGRKELVVNGETAVTAYDPATGKVLWTCKSFAGRGEPTVTPGHGLVFVINGLAGDIYSIRPGGNGDVTKSNMAWHTPRKGARDQPSPILEGKYLLVADMKGLTTCYDRDTGKELWKERLRSGAFTSSPIAAGGLVYFQNEAGETFVIRPGPKLDIVTENSLGANSAEVFRSSLTPYDGQMFTRSQNVLYCFMESKGK
jgi:outer membrane protein assembly factor BamB